MKRPLFKTLAVGLSAVYFLSNCALAYSAEASFWSERRKPVPVLASAAGLNLPSLQRFPSLQAPAAIASVSSFQSKKKSNTPLITSVIQSVPTSIGTLRKISKPLTDISRSTVLLLQDVHMNPEAQANLSKIISNVSQNHEVDLVALEGETETLDLKLFRSFSDQDSIKTAADFFFKEQKLSGPAFSLLTNSRLPSFLSGVDDAAHYDANVEAYKHSLPYLAEEKSALRDQTEKIQRAKTKVFNTKLKSFDTLVQKYRRNETSLRDYVAVLNTLDPGVYFHLFQFLEAARAEAALSFSNVEKERTQLLAELLKKLSAQDVSALTELGVMYRLGNISHGNFYAALEAVCEKNGVSLRSFPEMKRYIQYLLLCEKLDGEKVLAELKESEHHVYDILSSSDEEKRIIQESRRLFLNGKLLDFSLSMEEWGEYKRLKSPPLAPPLRGGEENLFLSRRGGREINNVPPLEEGTMSRNGPVDNADHRNGRLGGEDKTPFLTPFESFYHHAEARDQKMADNLLRQIREKKAQLSVFVVGGFHAAGITQRLSSADVTVLSFVPTLTRVENESGSQYLSVFTQAKSPLEEIFQGQKLFVSPRPMTSPAEMAVVAAATTHHRLGGTFSFHQALEKLAPKMVARVSFQVKKLSNLISIRFGSSQMEIKFGDDGAILNLSYKKAGMVASFMAVGAFFAPILIPMFNSLFSSVLAYPFWALGIFVMTGTIHEFAHAVVQDALGDPTPRQAGRLSLNPLRHLDLKNSLFKPVPFDPQKTHLVSILAGPVSNLLIAGFLTVLFNGVPSTPDIVMLAIQINLWAGVGNLFLSDGRMAWARLKGSLLPSPNPSRSGGRGITSSSPLRGEVRRGGITISPRQGGRGVTANPSPSQGGLPASGPIQSKIEIRQAGVRGGKNVSSPSKGEVGRGKKSNSGGAWFTHPLYVKWAWLETPFVFLVTVGVTETLRHMNIPLWYLAWLMYPAFFWLAHLPFNSKAFFSSEVNVLVVGKTIVSSLAIAFALTGWIGVDWVILAIPMVYLTYCHATYQSRHKDMVDKGARDFLHEREIKAIRSDFERVYLFEGAHYETVVDEFLRYLMDEVRSGQRPGKVAHIVGRLVAFIYHPDFFKLEGSVRQLNILLALDPAFYDDAMSVKPLIEEAKPNSTVVLNQLLGIQKRISKIKEEYAAVPPGGEITVKADMMESPEFLARAAFLEASPEFIRTGLDEPTHRKITVDQKIDTGRILQKDPNKKSDFDELIALLDDLHFVVKAYKRQLMNNPENVAIVTQLLYLSSYLPVDAYRKIIEILMADPVDDPERFLIFFDSINKKTAKPGIDALLALQYEINTSRDYLSEIQEGEVVRLDGEYINPFVAQIVLDNSSAFKKLGPGRYQKKSTSGGAWFTHPLYVKWAWLETPFVFIVAGVVTIVLNNAGYSSLSPPAWFLAPVLFWVGHLLGNRKAFLSETVLVLLGLKTSITFFASHYVSLSIPSLLSYSAVLFFVVLLTYWHWFIQREIPLSPTSNKSVSKSTVPGKRLKSLLLTGILSFSGLLAGRAEAGSLTSSFAVNSWVTSIMALTQPEIKDPQDFSPHQINTQEFIGKIAKGLIDIRDPNTKLPPSHTGHSDQKTDLFPVFSLARAMPFVTPHPLAGFSGWTWWGLGVLVLAGMIWRAGYSHHFRPVYFLRGLLVAATVAVVTWAGAPANGQQPSSATTQMHDGEQELRNRIMSLAQQAIQHIRDDHWVSPEQSGLLLFQLEQTIVKGDFVVDYGPDAKAGIPFRIKDGKFYVNGDYVPKLSDEEALPMVVHEAFHVTPVQQQRNKLHKQLYEGLPGTLRLVASDPKHRENFKRMKALLSRNEVEAYLTEMEFRTKQAQTKGETLRDHLRRIAAQTSFPHIADTYNLYIEALDHPEIPFEDYILYPILTGRLKGPEERMLLLIAQADGVNLSDDAAVQIWARRWLKDPVYYNFGVSPIERNPFEMESGRGPLFHPWKAPLVIADQQTIAAIEQLRRDFPTIEIKDIEEVPQSRQYVEELRSVLRFLQQTYPDIFLEVKKIVFNYDDPQHPFGSSSSNADGGIVYLGTLHLDGTRPKTYAGVDRKDAAPKEAPSRLAYVFLHETGHIWIKKVNAEIRTDLERFYAKLISRYNAGLPVAVPIPSEEFLVEDLANYLFTGQSLTQLQIFADHIIEGEKLSGNGIVDVSDSRSERAEKLGVVKSISDHNRLKRNYPHVDFSDVSAISLEDPALAGAIARSLMKGFDFVKAHAPDATELLQKENFHFRKEGKKVIFFVRDFETPTNLYKPLPIIEITMEASDVEGTLWQIVASRMGVRYWQYIHDYPSIDLWESLTKKSLTSLERTRLIQDRLSGLKANDWDLALKGSSGENKLKAFRDTGFSQKAFRDNLAAYLANPVRARQPRASLELIFIDQLITDGAINPQKLYQAYSQLNPTSFWKKAFLWSGISIILGALIVLARRWIKRGRVLPSGRVVPTIGLGFLFLIQRAEAGSLTSSFAVNSWVTSIIALTQPEIKDPQDVSPNQINNQEYIQKIAEGLIDIRDPNTKLPPSHTGHSDQKTDLFLYDLAHNAIELKLAGKQVEAEEMLDYVKARLDFSLDDVKEKKDQNNYYGIRFYSDKGPFIVDGINNAIGIKSQEKQGLPTVDYFVTPGPMAWLGLAFLQVNQEKYLPYAIQVGESLLKMQDENGGVRDGNRGFTNIHVEPHMDAHALFRELGKITNDDKWEMAEEKAWRWFATEALDKDKGTILQGVWGGKPHDFHATDPYTWTIAGVPEKLDLATIQKLISTVEKRSLVKVTFTRPDEKTVTAVLSDFTDPTSPEVIAAPLNDSDGERRGKYHPVGTAEWSAGFVTMYQVAAVKAWNEGQQELATEYKAKAEALLAQTAQTFYEHNGSLFATYATAGWVATGHGWKTPKFEKPGDNSTASNWFIISLAKFNPFIIGGGDLSIELEKIPSLKPEEAQDLLEKSVQHEPYVEEEKSKKGAGLQLQNFDELSSERTLIIQEIASRISKALLSPEESMANLIPIGPVGLDGVVGDQKNTSFPALSVEEQNMVISLVQTQVASVRRNRLSFSQARRRILGGWAEFTHPISTLIKDANVGLDLNVQNEADIDPAVRILEKLLRQMKKNQVIIIPSPANHYFEQLLQEKLGKNSLRVKFVEREGENHVFTLKEGKTVMDAAAFLGAVQKSGYRNLILATQNEMILDPVTINVFKSQGVLINVMLIVEYLNNLWGYILPKGLDLGSIDRLARAVATAA